MDGEPNLQVVLSHFDVDILVLDKLMNKYLKAVLLFLFRFLYCFVVDLNELSDGRVSDQGHLSL